MVTFENLRLIAFVWIRVDSRLGILPWQLPFENFDLMTFAWDLSLGIFRLGTLALGASFGNFRLITSAEGPPPGSFHLGYFALELS